MVESRKATCALTAQSTSGSNSRRNAAAQVLVSPVCALVTATVRSQKVLHYQKNRRCIRALLAFGFDPEESHGPRTRRSGSSENSRLT